MQCGGRPLPCDPCRIDNLECVLDLTLDGRRKASVKRVQEDLEAYQNAFRQLLSLVSEPGGRRLQKLLPLLQKCDSFEEIAAHLEASTSDHKEELRQEGHHKEENDFDCAQLSSIPPEHENLSDMNAQDRRIRELQALLNATLVSKMQSDPEDEALRILQQLRTGSNYSKWYASLGGRDGSQRPALNVSFLNGGDATRPLQLCFTGPSRGSPPSPPSSGLAMIHPGSDCGTSSDNATRESGQSTPDGTISSLEMPADPGDDDRSTKYQELQRLAVSAQKLPSLFGEFAERLDDHITCAAVLQGWIDLKSQVCPDPQWEIFEQWDRHFSNISVVDRIALLRMLRRVGKWLAAPDPSSDMCKRSVPHFYLPVPSQRQIHVSHIFNYTPWPGIRTMMIQNPTRFQTNRFWNLYCRSIHLIWPFNLADICSNNKNTNMMTISESFTQRCFDLNGWALSKELLDCYPELRPYAHQYEPSPVSSLIVPAKRTMRVIEASRDSSKQSRRQ